MPKIQIGDKQVEVGEDFLKLPPEQQQNTVNEIGKKLGIGSPIPTSTMPMPEEGKWRTGDIAPIKKEYTVDKDGRMHDTGEWRFAVPNMIMGIIDSIKLPGEVMRGEVDPMSEEGFDRTMNMAMNTVGGGIAGKTGRVAKTGMGEVVSETVDNLPTKAAAPSAIKEARLGNEIPIKQETPKPSTTIPPTQIDADLDAWFANNKITEGKTKGKFGEVLKPDPDLEMPKVELKVKQAERLMNAAKTKNIIEFQTQAEKAFELNRTKLEPWHKSLLIDSKNAIMALDDPVKVSNFIDELAKAPKKATWSDRIVELWINSLLSGPQTHMVNSLSNELVNIFGMAESGMSAALSKVTGSGITFKEVGHEVMGNIHATGDALRAAGASFRTEAPLFETGKIEQRIYGAIPGKAGKVIRTPGRLLTAEDAFFKIRAYRQKIWGLAIRQADSEGLSGKQLASRISDLKTNPTDDMISEARQYANVQTQSVELGVTGKHIQSVLNSSNALRFIVPFFRTPVNLVKFAAKRTPVAPFIFKEVRDDVLGRNGPVKRDQAISRIALGSAVGGYTMYQAMNGNVSGYGPSDPNSRKVWLAAGNQPYSIKVGDTWYSYSRLEPLGTILGISADMATLKDQIKGDEAENIAVLIALSISRNAASKTWLKGPVELAEVLDDPKRYGNHYVQKMLGTVVPAGIAQYARTQDPYLREAETILDGIKERVPGYRETLALRRDPFGEPIKSEGGLGPDIISPIYERMAKNDPTIAEMMRLEVNPGRVLKNIEGADLNPEEWDYYSAASGRTVKMFMDATVNSPVYKELPDNLRRTLLEDNMRKARDIARSISKINNPDLMLRIVQKKISDQFPSQQPQSVEEPVQ